MITVSCGGLGVLRMVWYVCIWIAVCALWIDIDVSMYNKLLNGPVPERLGDEIRVKINDLIIDQLQNDSSFHASS